MKFATNDLLKSALGRANATIKALGQRTFDVSRIRSDFSPKQNYEALKRLLSFGRFELINDVNSGTHGTGYISRLGDTAVAQYLLVQKGASLATNVAVFTSGNPIGTAPYGGMSTTEYTAVRLLSGAPGTALLVSDGTAAVAVGDILVGVSGGKVKTNTATTTEILIVGVAVETCGNGATGSDQEFEAFTCYNNKSV